MPNLLRRARASLRAASAQHCGPRTVAIFMDGNRRWAKARGLPAYKGHEAGKDVFLRFVDFYTDVREEWGAENYIFYAFSTENWNRSAEEVAHIMGVIEHVLNDFARQLPRLMQEGIRVQFIGQRERLSSRIRTSMDEVERATKKNAEGAIVLAVSYGGHADIISAANAALSAGKRTLTEADIDAHLSTAALPEVDLIIRPGGERRLSNFLVWQSAYSEFYFTETLWPDFTRYELERIFADFALRERRRGK